MLTKLRIKNFKQLGEVEIELGQSVVFVGPNNSGKTTALQALALWYVGLHKWNEKRSGQSSPEKRPGVAVNRRDLIAIPVPNANLLWRDLRVRNVQKIDGKQQTQNIRIDIIVEGVTANAKWQCGLEFDYANEESFYCRPLRMTDNKEPDRMPIPKDALDVRIALLPPMSGLTAEEPFIQPGRINVLVGEGQTAQVLRNLCYQIYEEQPDNWEQLTQSIKELFGVTLLPPEYVVERGEIRMSYKDINRGGIELGLSSSGRGMLQNLLLFAYLLSNPKSVLLFDEPDAHLEVLRQRQIYQLLTETAEKQSSQIIAASHSEILLNEAAKKDMVVAFVGKPHRIDSRAEDKVLAALTNYGFDQYYQAQQTGWVLYLEGSTDLAILKTFAEVLNHEEAIEALASPFVVYLETNVPQEARKHFYAIKHAYPDLIGIALFDRLETQLRGDLPTDLTELAWQKREIENYFTTQDVLERYATQYDLDADLFGHALAKRRREAMNASIKEVTSALEVLDKPSPWSDDIKASDDFLKPLFERYFKELDLPNDMRKRNYHILAQYIAADELNDEVRKKLDQIVSVAQRAKPYQG